MAFPCIEAKLDYLCTKMEQAGWELSLAPEISGMRGWQMTKGEVTHKFYIDADAVKKLGGEDRGRLLIDQNLCAQAVRAAGLEEIYHLL